MRQPAWNQCRRGYLAIGYRMPCAPKTSDEMTASALTPALGPFHSAVMPREHPDVWVVAGLFYPLHQRMGMKEAAN